MTERRCEQRFPCDPTSVTAARWFIRQTLSEWSLSQLGDDAALAVSELVANAVRHAATDVMVSVVADERVTISVSDDEPAVHSPLLRHAAGHLPESGRGLHIIAAISSDWGIRSHATGKVVWFTLELPTVPTEAVDLTGPKVAADGSSRDDR